MHSFIHSFNPTYSLYHSFTRTNDASPLPFITIINHQPCIARTTKCGIRTCTHDVIIGRTQWNAFACIPLANHLTERHTCMHACIDMTTTRTMMVMMMMMVMPLPWLSHPMNVLMSIFDGDDKGGGGGIDRRIDAAASLMLRVD